jgi:hypothetical protein
MKDTNTDNARKVTINIVKANIFAIVLMVASAVVLIVPYCLIWGGKWKTGGVERFFDSFFSNGVVFLVAMLVGVVVHELKAAREKLDGHYRAFITYLNAVQELHPEESLSKAAQFYNADLAKIELQYQQSRKKGGKDDDPTPEPETEEAI